MKRLEINGEDLGVIHGKRTIAESRIWLTAHADATWWIVVEGPDQEIRTVGFALHDAQERACQTFEDLRKPDVLQALLEGRDS